MTRYYLELAGAGPKGSLRRAGPYPTEKMAEAMKRTYEPLFHCEGKVVAVDED
jgi:hypothetical protein